VISARICTVALLVFFAFACQKTVPSPDLNIDYNIKPQPARVGDVTIDLKVTHKDGQAAGGARVELEGNMSHPGMSPVMSETKEIEPGRYRGTLQLPMAGDWIILVHLTLADGQRLQRQLELNVQQD
jgi:hypothetical protein